MKYKAKTKFSTTVMHDGSNVYVAVDAGDEVDLEEDIAELVNRDCGIVLTKVKSTAKPKTRQVTKANSR